MYLFVNEWIFSFRKLRLRLFVCLFVCLLFYVPRKKFSLDHLETLPLPVNGFKFWPMLGTHGRWAVGFLYRSIPNVGISNIIIWSSPRTRNTHTCCRVFGSGAVTTCFYDIGQSPWDSNSQLSTWEANAM